MSPQPEISALFQLLDGRTFPSYVDLERAVRERFRDARTQFPAEFGYRDAISWAADRGVIVVDDDQLVIHAAAQLA